jgi:hypothetical protein
MTKETTDSVSGKDALVSLLIWGVYFAVLMIIISAIAGYLSLALGLGESSVVYIGLAVIALIGADFAVAMFKKWSPGLIVAAVVVYAPAVVIVKLAVYAASLRKPVTSEVEELVDMAKKSAPL